MDVTGNNGGQVQIQEVLKTWNFILFNFGENSM